MGLAALGTVWQTEMQREREHELLFIGEQFGLALWRYYEASPDAKAYPRRLEDLLEDRRHAVPRRHLRQIFVDPLTGRRDWVVIMSGGQITAVRSRSQGEPIVRAGFPPGREEFAGATTHAEWLFTPLAPRAGALASNASAVPAADAAAVGTATGSWQQCRAAQRAARREALRREASVTAAADRLCAPDFRVGEATGCYEPDCRPSSFSRRSSTAFSISTRFNPVKGSC